MTSKDYNRVREETESEKGKSKRVEVEEMGKKGNSIKQGAGSRGVKSSRKCEGAKSRMGENLRPRKIGIASVIGRQWPTTRPPSR